MERARRHQRLLSALAFGLLALVAELAGRSLTHRLDFGRHVAAPSYAHADYYPILLAVVKGGIALLLARLCSGASSRARSAERAALRLLGGRAARCRAPVRAVRPALARLLPPDLADLPRADRRRGRRGRPLAAARAVAALLGAAGLRGARRPRARSSGAPFAAGSPTTRSYARATVDRARCWRRRRRCRGPRPRVELAVPPRRIFGLAFESRPPPLPA